MNFFGLSTFETGVALSALISFVWWASGMYHQTKRGADKANEIGDELRATRREFHNRTEKLFAMYGDHGYLLQAHAVDIARLKDRVGIPSEAIGARSSRVDP